MARLSSPSPVIGALWGIGGPATQSMERGDTPHGGSIERVSVSPSPRDEVFDIGAMQDNPGPPPMAAMFNEASPAMKSVIQTPPSAAMRMEPRGDPPPERNLYQEIQRIEEEEEEYLPPPTHPTPAIPKPSKPKRSKSASKSRSTSKGTTRVSRSDTATTVPQRTRNATPPAAKSRQGEIASARLAISHTARSYQLEKQSLMHKHEEELHELKRNYEDEIKGLRKTIAKMHSEFASRRGEEITTIRSQLNSTNEEAAATKIALQQAAEENCLLSDELHAARQKIKALEAMREDDKQRVMSTLENWQAHYQNIEAAKNEEIVMLKDAVAEQESSLVSFDHLKQRLGRSEEEVMRLSKQLDMCNTQLEQSNKRVLEKATELEAIKMSYEEFLRDREMIEGLHDTIAQLRRSNAVHQEERALMENKVKELQAEITRRIANEAILQEDLSNSKCQVTAEKLKEIELSGRQSLFHSELQASYSRESLQHKEKEALRNQIIEITARLQNAEAASQAASRHVQQLSLENERLRREMAHPY
eukprot:TRINITY_DN7125_c0_g2_i1.p1 TRINITY_DN7125_c0_g2~~TRINITY_DN7125_c0_g2_i1.p1  ORF type:complete len:533 (+),score=197.99 TRINITY_DN7125_c0_g2_i1:66-1664(+)